MAPTEIVCFGETLWDILPHEKIAGGAPMNVAIRLAAWGHRVKLISRVGLDEEGKMLSSILKNQGVNTSLLQIDNSLPTGKVFVSLNDEGNASYEIVAPSAWDEIVANEETLKAVASAKAFVFGSLASRNSISGTTLKSLVSEANYKVFDVNLRKPFINLDFISALLKESQFVKLNDEEILYLTEKINGNSLSNTPDNLICCIEWLQQYSTAETICVTRGAQGAILLHKGKTYTHPGYRVEVKDTIGAGDSFLATLLSRLFTGSSPSDALADACAVGALVASHKGANPTIILSQIEVIKKPLGRNQGTYWLRL